MPAQPPTTPAEADWPAPPTGERNDAPRPLLQGEWDAAVQATSRAFRPGTAAAEHPWPAPLRGAVEFPTARQIAHRMEQLRAEAIARVQRSMDHRHDLWHARQQVRADPWVVFDEAATIPTGAITAAKIESASFIMPTKNYPQGPATDDDIDIGWQEAKARGVEEEHSSAWFEAGVRFAEQRLGVKPKE